MTTSLLESNITCEYSQIQYTKKCAFPQSRSKHAACLHDNYVYLLSGKDGNIALKDMWRFSIGNLKWEKLSFHGDILQHLEGHTLVSCKKLMLLFGGKFGDSLTESSLWIINADLAHIRKVILDSGSDRPCVRRHHTAVVHCEAMYIYGGYIDIKGSSAELWKYHVDDESWELISPKQSQRDTPGGRHGHTAVVYNNHMWLYGGMTDLIPKQDFWTYSFVANRWEIVPYKYGPPALTGHSANVIGTQMFVFGGETNRIAGNQLWCYCFRANVWCQITTGEHLPPRTMHAAVNVNSSQQQDIFVKANSVPFLHKKVAKLSLERPKSSPNGQSATRRSLQESESQKFSEQCISYTSIDKSDIGICSVSLVSSCQGAVPQLLNLDDNNCGDNSELYLLQSDNVADKSPLCPKITDFHYHAIDIQDRNINSGFDNPGISDSTEQLILDGFNRKSLINEVIGDGHHVSAFMRSLSYTTDAEKHKQLQHQHSESLVSMYTGNTLDSDENFSHFGTKRFKLDPELVAEDLEYSDCFPRNVHVPYPISHWRYFKTHASKKSLLQDLDQNENIELEEMCQFSSKSPAAIRDVQHSNLSTPICNKSHANANNHACHSSMQTVNGQEDCRRYPNMEEAICQKELVPGNARSIQNIMETSLECQPLMKQNRHHGKICPQDRYVAEMNHSISELPYILVLGGKDNTTVNFTLEPLPLWKLYINVQG